MWDKPERFAYSGSVPACRPKKPSTRQDDQNSEYWKSEVAVNEVMPSIYQARSGKARRLTYASPRGRFVSIALALQIDVYMG